MATPETRPEAPPSPSFVPRWVRAAVSSAAALSPRLAAWTIERAWFTPPRPHRPRAALALLDGCRPIRLEVSGGRVAAWVAGAGPLVTLVHGWGGYGAQLGPFVGPLVVAGFRVAVFDAPGHGASASSPLGFRQGSFSEFAHTLETIATVLGPLHGVVAHSGGAVATGIALRAGLPVERIVLVAAVADPGRYAEQLDRAFGLSPQLSERWRARAERRVGARLGDLGLAGLARERALPPALVVHDRGDREVPFSEADTIVRAWPGAVLHATEGLGHRRILGDEAVVDRAARFLAAAAGAPAAA